MDLWRRQQQQQQPRYVRQEQNICQYKKTIPKTPIALTHRLLGRMSYVKWWWWSQLIFIVIFAFLFARSRAFQFLYAAVSGIHLFCLFACWQLIDTSLRVLNILENGLSCLYRLLHIPVQIPQVYGSNMTYENEKKYYLPSLDLSYSLGELFFFVEATGLRALLIG